MEGTRKPGTPPPPPEDGTFTCPINWIYSLRYDYTGASGAVAEMLEVILQAWNGDFASMPNDGNLKATARGWKAVVKASLIKQKKSIEQRSNAGKQSAENRQKLKEIAESLTADIQQEEQRASTSVNECQRARPNVNVNSNVNSNVKNPPIAPQGGVWCGTKEDFERAFEIAKSYMDLKDNEGARLARYAVLNPDAEVFCRGIHSETDKDKRADMFRLLEKDKETQRKLEAIPWNVWRDDVWPLLMALTKVGHESDFARIYGERSDNPDIWKFLKGKALYAAEYEIKNWGAFVKSIEQN